MKSKLIFLHVILLFTFSSCKKSTENPIEVPLGTISASFNGAGTTFNYSAKATVLTVPNGYGIRIHGYKRDPGASGTDIQITVVRPSPITTGTYIEKINENPLVLLSHFTDIFFGSGITSSSYYSTTNPVTVNITAISSTSVQGTFNGELQFTALDGSIQKELITGGVFNVSF